MAEITTASDPYHRIAGIYDRLFDRMNKGLRLAGIRMFRPKQGMHILDVGCGTGSHLALYQRYECQLYGLDRSPSMLAIARQRLGSQARLDLADATSMPYQGNQFDLIICMLSIHEMSPDTRAAAVDEMKRVLKESGRLLLIDFHTGPYLPLQGWISKTIIFISELAAGREHFKNYREFMRSKGLEAQVNRHDLVVENKRILAGGTFACYLLTK